MDNNELIFNKSDKKLKNLISLCIVLIFLILAIIGFVIYGALFNFNPKKHVSSIINKAYEISTNLTYELDNARYLSETVNYTGELKINTNIPDIKEFNNYKLNYNIGMDYKNKKMVLASGISDNEKTIIDITSYFQEGIAYLKSTTIFSDIIRYKDASLNELFNKNNATNIKGSDLNYLISVTKDTIINSISNEDFKKEQDEINYNGKQVKVNKISYIFDKDKQNKICKNLNNTYKSDEKILNIISNVTGKNIEEIKKDLEKNNKIESTDIITINMYVKSNKVLKYELIASNENSESTTEFIINENVYTINMYEKNSSDNNKIIIKKNSDKNYKLEMYNNDIKIITLDIIKESKNKYNVTYNIAIEKNSIYGTLNIETINDSDDKTTSTVSISMIIKEESKEYKIDISNTLTEEYIEKLDEINVKSAINGNNLSDQYIQKIYSNIQKQLENTPFKALLNSVSDNTNYNYSTY